MERRLSAARGGGGGARIKALAGIKKHHQTNRCGRAGARGGRITSRRVINSRSERAHCRCTLPRHFRRASPRIMTAFFIWSPESIYARARTLDNITYGTRLPDNKSFRPSARPLSFALLLRLSRGVLTRPSRASIPPPRRNSMLAAPAGPPPVYKVIMHRRRRAETTDFRSRSLVIARESFLLLGTRCNPSRKRRATILISYGYAIFVRSRGMPAIVGCNNGY